MARAHVLARPLTPSGDDDLDWLHVPATSHLPAHYVYRHPIQKSQQDDREYRAIKLENGLQAVLVHDATIDKAAASLEVAVGHLYDPDDVPGLAHFCEHLLFMGTEQHPKENEYSEYLSKNGGSSNAYTAASSTNYYFDVGVAAFSGALDRFSGFFHSPLFSPSCTLRELNAVDSENKKNLQSDMWRIFQLNKHLTKPSHPWKKFGTGNKATLTEAARAAKLQAQARGVGTTGTVVNGKLASGSPVSASSSRNASSVSTPNPSRVGSPAPSVQSVASEDDADGGAIGRETRRRLIEWWSHEYCASRMSLALIGKESLDHLTELAVKYFSPIPNRGRDPAPQISDHPFGPDEKSTIIHVKTVMDFNAIELSFPLPDQSPHWRVKPASFIAHMVGHEGPGSLYTYLKNRGWATSLSAGSQSLGRGFAMFKVTVHLTKDGFQNYREALLTCYKYLNLLRKSPLPEWYQSEIQRLDEMHFRFAEKRKPDAYATWIAEHMKWPTPRSRLLSGPQLVWGWEEAEVRHILDNLTVEQGRVVVMGQEHHDAGEIGVQTAEVKWEKEPWYGTEYTARKIEENFAELARQENDNQELFLPRPNEFIPTNLDVEKRDVAQPLKRPILVKRTPLVDVWHKKDDQFWVPKAQVMIDMRSPVAHASPRAAVLTRLYTELVTDSLSEYAYDADLAGLRYNFASHSLGLFMSVAGYNDKLHVLVRDVLGRMKNIQLKHERLAVIKEQLKQRWENFFLGQSYTLSDYYARFTLTEHQYAISEQLTEITSINLDELHQHIHELLLRLKFNIFVNGNLRKDEAIRIANMAAEIVRAQPLLEKEIPHKLSRILPEACNYIWELPVPNPNQTNSSVTYYCHVGDIASPRLRATFRLLAQIIHEPAFNVLRTKEQLGYIVFASEWQGTESLGLRVLVQSEKDPKYLEARIDAFLGYMRGVLETMDDAEFEEQKKGLIHKWSEKLKNLNEETSRFWIHIESEYLDFQQRERDAVLLQTVTKDEVLALFSKYIDPVSQSRSKLSVHLRPQKVAPPKFSVQAAQAFVERLRAHSIPIDEDQFLSLCANHPPVAAAKAHWTGVLLGGSGEEINTSSASDGIEHAAPVDVAVATQLLEELDALGRQYPVDGEGEVRLSQNVAFIKDPQAFKAGLRLSAPARAVEEFHDLPVSRF